jgi:hypothetical protein
VRRVSITTQKVVVLVCNNVDEALRFLAWPKARQDEANDSDWTVTVLERKFAKVFVFLVWRGGHDHSHRHGVMSGVAESLDNDGRDVLVGEEPHRLFGGV